MRTTRLISSLPYLYTTGAVYQDLLFSVYFFIEEVNRERELKICRIKSDPVERQDKKTFVRIERENVQLASNYRVSEQPWMWFPCKLLHYVSNI